MKPVRRTQQMSGPERSACGFTSAQVDGSGALAWWNKRQAHTTAGAPSKMASALTEAIALSKWSTRGEV